MTWPLFVLCLAFALALLPNIRIVREGERLIVFRLGRFHRILQPGLNLIVWGIDMPHVVTLNSVVPDWCDLPQDELDARLQHLAITGQLSRSA